MTKNGEYKQCEICLKEVYIQKYRLKTFRFCSPKCRGKYGASLTVKGRFVKGGKGFTGKHTEETKRKVSESRRGKAMGAKNPSWKGGVTPEIKKIRKSFEYKLWRKAVFERDNWACVWCGNRQSAGNKVILHGDHIKPFALYPELRFAIDNGRTLCQPCHRTTDTYGYRLYSNKSK